MRGSSHPSEVEAVRPQKHPNGHMSQAVKDRKAANAKAKKAAEKETTAA